jgi:hypothetical protein
MANGKTVFPFFRKSFWALGVIVAASFLLIIIPNGGAFRGSRVTDDIKVLF